MCYKQCYNNVKNKFLFFSFLLILCEPHRKLINSNLRECALNRIAIIEISSLCDKSLTENTRTHTHLS